ncbi:MAG: UTP--glucose-1-phosphate uridylyltransferase [Candidatus Brocadiia bacterium]
MALQYEELRSVAEEHGQGHIFQWWEELDDAEAEGLLAQVAEIDFDLLDRLIEEHVRNPQEVRLGELEPAQPIPLPCTEEEREARRRAVAKGQEALRAGRVAALVVAGGQGTRLGYDGPKGTFPAGPVTGKPLFQLHAEKIRAASRRYGVRIPWYIMTSEANDAATRSFFDEHRCFGLDGDDVVFFRQGTMPAVDLEGKLLMAGKGRIATSPNGHGGTLAALRDTGALDDLRRRGIDVISYSQVDNPLIRIIDPAFIGHHLDSGSEFSSKSLPKRDAEEGLGVFCYVDGQLRVVEYSDLPEECKYATEPDGSLRFSAGNIAIHILAPDLVERLTEEGASLPYHRALKKVPHVDAQGRSLEPDEPNGVKFEMFIFDALPHATNPLVMTVRREEEFAPIKRAEGEDSPHTARQAQVDLFGRWLEQAGVAVPRDQEGNVAGSVEISPLVARDAEELRQRLPQGTAFRDGLYLGPEAG